MARCHGTYGHTEVNPYGDEEEMIFSENSGSSQDVLFDTIVGHLQDLVIEDQFNTLQRTFMDKYYEQFEDVEENKLIYTDIHKEYIELIEKYIQKELEEKCPGFNMEKFMKMLEVRKLEIPEEIFEIFLSFTDFLTFKQMLLDYRADKEGMVPNLDGLIINSPMNQ